MATALSAFKPDAPALKTRAAFEAKINSCRRTAPKGLPAI
jgi:hypothetical protein